MRRGVVMWFDGIKGYGYIESDDGEEVFVHYTNIDKSEGMKTLEPGKTVEFESVSGEFGQKAIYVKELY